MRPTGVHPARLAVVGVALLATTAPLPAAASCAPPVLTVVAAGDALEVRGSGFVDGCRDTCSCRGVGGCERCDCGPPVRPAVRAVVQLLDAQRNVVAEQDVPADGGAFTARLPASGAGASVSAVGRTSEGAQVPAEVPVP